MEMQAVKSKSALETSILTTPYRKEYCITVHGDDPLKAEKDLSGFKAADCIDRFLFGGVSQNSSYLKTTQMMNCGINWLQGDAAAADEELTGIQAFAVSGISPEPINIGGRCIGFIYEDGDAYYCRLSGIYPQDIKASRPMQTLEVLQTIDKILNKYSFQFTDVVRTWFYLDKLLEWYKEFNNVRTAFFERKGVFKKLVPASTGIGAGNHSGGALTCSVLAVKPKNPDAKIFAVQSPLQGSAMDYKSSFSRAVEMDFVKWRYISISGTASISRDGQSVNIGDTASQIDLTMKVVKAILESRKMSWSNLFRGIAYFKDISEKDLLLQYMEENKISKFPLLFAHTDICRDDLLFELEADAVESSRL